MSSWVVVHWYYALLAAAGFIVMMAVFIHCAKVHTPSSNPNLPTNRNFGATLKQPIDTLRRRTASRGQGNGECKAADF